MNNHLDSECLKLNANWIPIGVITVRKAFEDAGAGAVTLLRFVDGYPVPYRLEDWLNIPVEDKEDHISISGRYRDDYRKIAIPRVVVCVNFKDIIKKEQKFNLKNLAKHYNYTCAVSKKKLKPEEYSREHVRPKSKGGVSGWEHEVLMDRELNSRRSNKSYRKFGLKKPTILPPPKPKAPYEYIVNRHGYPEWDLFKIPRVPENMINT